MIGIRLVKAQQISKKLYFEYHGDTDQNDPRMLDCHGSFKKVRKPCSCYMCGNPRKWFKEITYQEKISDINYKEQLKHLQSDLEWIKYWPEYRGW